jgi:hypothetical protein
MGSEGEVEQSLVQVGVADGSLPAAVEVLELTVLEFELSEELSELIFEVESA